MARALVTGARGFVGRHLVRALRDRGDAVRALDVTPSVDADSVQADVRDADALRRACEDVDVVFHVASVVHTRNTDRDLVFAINEGGTHNVIEACRAQGVTRLVHVSSASVVYEGRDIEHGDESLPYAAISQAPYADSKIAAEKAVLAAHSEALSTCALRPHVVFGPHDTRFLPAIISRAKAGKLKLGVGTGRELSDFTYIDNLVDALLLAGERLRDTRDVVGGQAYFITNGEPTPFFDFVGRVLCALELPPIRGHAPYWLAYSIASLAEMVARVRGQPVGQEDGLSRFAVRYMCTHHYFSIAKAQRDLGYAPAVDIDEGLRRTCDALRR